MSLAREITRRLPNIFAQLVLACVVVYFAYHAVEGERGLNAWWRLSQKIELSEATLTALTSQRVGLEERVAHLRPDSLDPDMLEERARVLLNFGRADEIVILSPKERGKE
ncbi:MAG: septum formation initiator family protein [Alphaproteobacteria bacterium]